MTNQERKLISENWFKALEKAQKDDAFKEKLIHKPYEAFKDLGFEIPKGLKFHVLEDSTTDRHLVIPHDFKQLTPEELKKITGGIMLPGTYQ